MVHLVKATVFPVVMCGCESQTIKKAEHWRIHAFELWCWRRLLRIPWTARKSNQSILKEISPEYSLEGLMLKLKLQLSTWYEELTHWKRHWCWEWLMVGGEGDARGWDGWMASPTWCTWVWASSRSWWWTGKLGVLQSMGSQRVRYNWVTEIKYSLFWDHTLLVGWKPLFLQALNKDLWAASGALQRSVTFNFHNKSMESGIIIPILQMMKQD